MPRSDVLYVITLVASSAPVPLPVLDESHFAGLAAFRSRRVEDGRERFRIHVGYFTSMSDAELVLPLLRETYPWAFIGPAPQSNLGSLDDTGIARFRIVRPAGAPAPATTVSPAAAVAPVATPAPVTTPGPVAAAAPRTPAAAVPPVLPMSDAVAVKPVAATQRYAVQLLWSTKPIDLAQIQSLGVFDGYLLYAVETRHGGRRMFGVRLGFYDDALSARLVALYVRPAYKGVVIPVSAREVESASRATIRLSGSRQARGRSAARDGWPRVAVNVPFSTGGQAEAAAQL